MQNKFQFEIGQETTVQFGDSATKKFVAQRDEFVPCVVIARKLDLIGIPIYLVHAKSQNKVGVASVPAPHCQGEVKGELWSMWAMTVGDGEDAQARTIEEATEKLHFDK